jgi:hypothetical protein
MMKMVDAPGREYNLLKSVIYLKYQLKLDKVNGYEYTQFAIVLSYTGYFTSDNEPDGIENATHNTFQYIVRVPSSFAFQMYCGLPFQFRRAHYHR